MCPPILCRRRALELSYDAPQRAFWKQMTCTYRGTLSPLSRCASMCISQKAMKAALPLAGRRRFVLAAAVFRRFRGCGRVIALPPSASSFCHRDAAQTVSAAVALLCNEASQPSFDVVSPTGATQADRGVRAGVGMCIRSVRSPILLQAVRLG